MSACLVCGGTGGFPDAKCDRCGGSGNARRTVQEWQAILVAKLPGEPLNAALREMQTEAREAGAAEMRERLVAHLKGRGYVMLAADLQALPLTAPSAGVPQPEPSGAPTEYSDTDSEEFG